MTRASLPDWRGTWIPQESQSYSRHMSEFLHLDITFVWCVMCGAVVFVRRKKEKKHFSKKRNRNLENSFLSEKRN